MDTVELAKRLISYDTTSPVTDPEAFQFLKGVLEMEGIDAEIHEINGVYNLLAEIGEGDTHICLNGHMDVVQQGNGWTVTDPFDPVVRDGKLYGRGAADMKSGLAGQIMAFIDLHEDSEFTGKATLMVVGDEEVGSGLGTPKLIEESDNHFDYAVIGEPTDSNIQVGCRGIYWVNIYLKGTSVHASRPHLVENIVNKVPDVLTALNNLELTYEKQDMLPEPTAPVTAVETSGPHNSIPGQVRIGLDIRYVPGQTEEQVREDIEKVLEPLDIEYRLDIANHGGAFRLEDERFKEIATETVTEVMGRTPHHITDGGSSDGRFFIEKGTPYIELGPNQKPGHQADEHCDVTDLEELREAYCKITKRLADA